MTGQAFGQSIHQFIAVLGPVYTLAFIFLHIKTDQPITQSQAGINGTTSLSRQFVIYLADGMDELCKVKLPQQNNLGVHSRLIPHPS